MGKADFLLFSLCFSVLLQKFSSFKLHFIFVCKSFQFLTSLKFFFLLQRVNSLPKTKNLQFFEIENIRPSGKFNCGWNYATGLQRVARKHCEKEKMLVPIFPYKIFESFLRRGPLKIITVFGKRVRER